MHTSFKKIVIPAISLSVWALALNCNNSNSGNGEASDSTKLGSVVDTVQNKMHNAEGKVEEGTNKAATSVEESMARNPDSTFVEDVMAANDEEIVILQGGIEKGGKELKNVAKMMIVDHKGLKTKLEKYATKNNYAVVADDMGKGEKELDDLSSKTGNDWDKAWAENMFAAHEQAIGKFEGAKNRVKDADLKAMIEQTLPTLRSHLQMVKNLQGNLKK